MKKIFALLLSLVLLISFSVSAYADGTDPADGACIPLAPVLGRQHQDRALDAAAEYLQQGLDLVAHVHSGDRCVAQGAHHDAVCQIDAEGHQILQRDGHRQGHKGLIKCVVLCKHIIHHRSHYSTQWGDLP